MKALIIHASPRRDGNTALLADAVAEGLREGRHETMTAHADDVVRHTLRDCRTCRDAQGRCTIDDAFRDVFLNDFVPAEGFILATPIYWYGMSAQAKAFFDRMFCYVAASFPDSERIKTSLMGKKIGLVLNAEENFPDVGAGIVHQIQEYCRYTRSTFVGVVQGQANARREVARDPTEPLAAARRFGETFFTKHVTDYQLDSPRSARVWG